MQKRLNEGLPRSAACCIIGMFNCSLLNAGMGYEIEAGGISLKRGSDQVRASSRTRTIRVDPLSKRNASVGSALRKAKRRLIIRRFVYLILAVLLIAAVIAIAYGGYFGKLIQYLIDRLM